MTSSPAKLSLGGVLAEELVEEYGSPLYVYESDIIKARYKELSSALTYPLTRLHYAVKANSNPAILRMLHELGSGVDATSPVEIALAFEAGFAPEDIIYTGVNSSADDLDFCHKAGVQVNIGSLYLLDYWGSRYPGSSVSVRVNPDVGAGHHDHTITGGPTSKFGIYYSELSKIEEIAKSHDLDIVGVHSHIGSGILETESFIKAMKIILETASCLNDLSFIDIGGGIGIPYAPEDTPIPLEELGANVSDLFTKFCKDYGRDLELKIEPGRYVVAESGTLLTTVTNHKSTSMYSFIGVDSGFNDLMRPVMYGSYHGIQNASRLDAPTGEYVVGGNLCESGDIFTRNEQGIESRMIPIPEMGDILAIRNSGAYGYSMASCYNGRLLPAEVMVSEGESRLIRRRQTFNDIKWGHV